jgi:hypothetical protein
VRRVVREQPRQPEVGDLDVELRVEEDVAGLDVAVHHRRLHGVEVRQRRGRLDGDAEPDRSRQRAVPVQVPLATNSYTSSSARLRLDVHP